MATLTCTMFGMEGSRIDGVFTGSTIAKNTYIRMNASLNYPTSQIYLGGSSKFNSAQNGTGSELCYVTNSAPLSFTMNYTTTSNPLSRIQFGDFSSTYAYFAFSPTIDQSDGAVLTFDTGDLRLVIPYVSSFSSSKKEQLSQGWAKRYLDWIVGNATLPAMSSVKQVWFSGWPGVSGSSNLIGSGFQRTPSLDSGGQDTLSNSTQNTTGSTQSIVYQGYYDSNTSEVVFYMTCSGTNYGSNPCKIANNGVVDYTSLTGYNYIVGGN